MDRICPPCLPHLSRKDPESRDFKELPRAKKGDAGWVLPHPTRIALFRPQPPTQRKGGEGQIEFECRDSINSVATVLTLVDGWSSGLRTASLHRQWWSRVLWVDVVWNPKPPKTRRATVSGPPLHTHSNDPLVRSENEARTDNPNAVHTTRRRVPLHRTQTFVAASAVEMRALLAQPSSTMVDGGIATACRRDSVRIQSTQASIRLAGSKIDVSVLPMPKP